MAKQRDGTTAATPISQDPRIEALRKSHGSVQWTDLQAHAVRLGLILFEGDDELIEVATALAEDSVDRVVAWQQSGVLRHPTAEELERWRHQPSKIFESIVVQPFVLAREKNE